MPRITFVTDGLNVESLAGALREHQFDVRIETPRSVVDGGWAATDLLIFDIVDPSEAIRLLKRMRSSESSRDTPVMVIAEWGTGQASVALSLGVDAFERAPIDAPRLLTAVESLLRPNMVMTARANTLSGDEE